MQILMHERYLAHSPLADEGWLRASSQVRVPRRGVSSNQLAPGSGQHNKRLQTKDIVVLRRQSFGLVRGLFFPIATLAARRGQEQSKLRRCASFSLPNAEQALSLRKLLASKCSSSPPIAHRNDSFASCHAAENDSGEQRCSSKFTDSRSMLRHVLLHAAHPITASTPIAFRY
jgi:hypothetical protein